MLVRAVPQRLTKEMIMADDTNGGMLRNVWGAITRNIWGFMLGVVLTVLVQVAMRHWGG